MFDILGYGVLAYVLFALASGRVEAKSGWRMRGIYRESRPRYFFGVLACYAALGVALIVLF
jgi:hypothetical protein